MHVLWLITLYLGAKGVTIDWLAEKKLLYMVCLDCLYPSNHFQVDAISTSLIQLIGCDTK